MLCRQQFHVQIVCYHKYNGDVSNGYIQRNELWKIKQPHLITFSAGIPIMVHTHLLPEAGATGPTTASVPKDAVTPHTNSLAYNNYQTTTLTPFTLYTAFCCLRPYNYHSYDTAHEGLCSNHLPTTSKDPEGSYGTSHPRRNPPSILLPMTTTCY
jgi:hypothetical protein